MLPYSEARASLTRVSGTAVRTTVVRRPVLGDRHGDVHHVLPQRLAVPDRPSRPPQQGGEELRTDGVVLHLRGARSPSRRAPGPGRAGPVGRDERDARARRLAQPLHERLELLRRVGGDGRDDLLAHERGARLQLALRVVESRSRARSARRRSRPRPCRGRRRRGTWRRYARRAAAYARVTGPAGDTPRRAPSRCTRRSSRACGAARRCARRPSGRSRSGR